MTDTSKIQFDQWHKRETQAFIAACEVEAARVMEGFKESMWSVWQASREAVVVELPAKAEPLEPELAEGQPLYTFKGEGRNKALDECRSAIEAQGLRCEVRP